MVRVHFKKEATCPIKAGDIKKYLSTFLVSEGLLQDADVSVVMVGQQEMLSLAQKYLGEKDVLHNVLSFPAKEGGDFIYPPGGTLYLGEIIVCYKKALEEAEEENLNVTEKVRELVCHGALHLLGKHHD